jgi:hypothetical protein
MNKSKYYTTHPVHNHKVVTEEGRKEIVRLRDSGKTYPEIEAITGINNRTAQTIYRRVKSGISYKRKKNQDSWIIRTGGFQFFDMSRKNYEGY